MFMFLSRVVWDFLVQSQREVEELQRDEFHERQWEWYCCISDVFIFNWKLHPESEKTSKIFSFLCPVSLTDGGASLADRESSLDLIKLDISRTFPSLFIFQKVTHLFRWTCSDHSSNLRLLSLFFLQGGPYHDLLHSVLGAYTCYRPDIGYVSLFHPPHL